MLVFDAYGPNSPCAHSLFYLLLESDCFGQPTDLRIKKIWWSLVRSEMNKQNLKQANCKCAYLTEYIHFFKESFGLKKFHHSRGLQTF